MHLSKPLWPNGIQATPLDMYELSVSFGIEHPRRSHTLPAGVSQGRRGWKSEFAKPYKPLGVPNLDVAPPTNILRQKDSSQKSFGTEGMKLLTSVTNKGFNMFVYVCV